MAATTMLSSPSVSNKKRKELATPSSDHPSSKKSKKDKKKYAEDPSSPTKHHKRKSKKPKESAQEWSEFSIVNAMLMVSIPPLFASDPRVGVEEMLDSMVMRHIPSLHGVVLSHSNLSFQQSGAIIQDDCPFAKCAVTFDATVWSPKVGMTLTGRVSLFAPDHISLLVHSTFNVSIPRSHIPSAEYEFEYGPAENDPEYGAGAQGDSGGVTEGMSSLRIDDGDNDGRVESIGRWINRDTGERCGGATGIVTFTVIGFTLVNQMMSLLGSLQQDPFNPGYSSQQSHPSPTVLHTPKPSQEDDVMSSTSDEDNQDPFDALHIPPTTQEVDAHQRMNGGTKKERKPGKTQKKAAEASTHPNPDSASKKAKKRKVKTET